MTDQERHFTEAKYRGLIPACDPACSSRPGLDEYAIGGHWDCPDCGGTWRVIAEHDPEHIRKAWAPGRAPLSWAEAYMAEHGAGKPPCICPSLTGPCPAHPDIPVHVPVRNDLEPWPPEQTGVLTYYMVLPQWSPRPDLWAPFRDRLPRASKCYRMASGAMVHVKPECRCPR